MQSGLRQVPRSSSKTPNSASLKPLLAGLGETFLLFFFFSLPLSIHLVGVEDLFRLSFLTSHSLASNPYDNAEFTSPCAMPSREVALRVELHRPKVEVSPFADLPLLKPMMQWFYGQAPEKTQKGRQGPGFESGSVP